MTENLRNKFVLPPKVTQLIDYLHQHDATVCLVGGCVRDFLLKNSLVDYDFEVFGIKDLDLLQSHLSKFGPVIQVGKAFGVLKMNIDNYEIDLSLPRTEIKVSKGHKGFTVNCDSSLDFKTAAFRRDFTINSMGINLKTMQLIDPYNGQLDLKNKCLRHTSDAFSEDPLRVYRAVQFAARFNFSIHPETQLKCNEMDLSELPKERIFEEFKKWFLKSEKPSIGLDIAKKLGVLEYFTEIKDLINCPQDPIWHPEGDVFEHTKLVLDQMALLKIGSPKEQLMYMFAALCHDFGKPATTKKIDNRWRSHRHEQAGEQPTRTFLNKLTNEHYYIDHVVPLVLNHLKPSMLYHASLNQGVSNAAIKRLSLKVNINQLLVLAHADHYGRLTEDAIKKVFKAGKWLHQKAVECKVLEQPPVPLLTGKDLIELGLQSGPKMGELLTEIYKMQLNDKLKSKKAAINYVKKV